MTDKILIVEESELRRIIRDEFSSVVDSETRSHNERESSPKIYVSADDVIDMTGYSQATIARKIKDGVLPIAKKEGKRNLFDKQEVEDLINQGKLKRNKSFTNVH